MAHAVPPLGERRDAVAHGHRHLDGALGGVGTRERIVEEGHQPVAREAVERSLEAVDEIAQRRVVLAEHQHQVLGLDGLGERREAAQVAEHDRDLLAMALEERLVAGRHDELGDLRREEAAQPSRSLELGDLLLDALLELPVPRGQLCRLRLDRVVVALDAQQRAHPREQLGLLEGLGDEVVGSRLDRRHLLLLPAGRDHHDRQEPGGLVGAQRPADLVAVHPGHDDVEQHEVDRLGAHALERLVARRRGDALRSRAGSGRPPAGGCSARGRRRPGSWPRRSRRVLPRRRSPAARPPATGTRAR